MVALTRRWSSCSISRKLSRMPLMCFARRALGLIRQLLHHRVIQACMLAIDLAFLRRPAVQVVDRRKHCVQGQIAQRLQGMYQHGLCEASLIARWNA